MTGARPTALSGSVAALISTPSDVKYGAFAEAAECSVRTTITLDDELVAAAQEYTTRLAPSGTPTCPIAREFAQSEPSAAAPVQNRVILADPSAPIDI